MKAFRATTVRVALTLLAATIGVGARAEAQRILIPMDDAQQNHLKAYGLTYNAIKANASAEWLLNYRGGSFLIADTPDLRRQAGLAGVTIEAVDNAKLSQIRGEIAANLAGLRILCVDNERAVLDAMEGLLRGWGCDVREDVLREHPLP